MNHSFPLLCLLRRHQHHHATIWYMNFFFWRVSLFWTFSLRHNSCLCSLVRWSLAGVIIDVRTWDSFYWWVHVRLIFVHFSFVITKIVDVSYYSGQRCVFLKILIARSESSQIKCWRCAYSFNVWFLLCLTSMTLGRKCRMHVFGVFLFIWVTHACDPNPSVVLRSIYFIENILTCVSFAYARWRC